jgi:hypothetical protein
LKLYLDEDLSPRIVALLRERGLDVMGTHEAGHAGRSDLEPAPSEFAILADAIAECVSAYPVGLADQILFLERPAP